ncbi:ROK family protein [Paenibacillus sp. FSL R7-0297]|uniref:ROK family protein n=1 Tax=unclassified Paenibacillus TaxID=185978 RepID=UPI0004F715AD|nr:ROK family protein [Paenibacillus sp. FSL R5-0912]AIQ42913.1 transcriptional regulator [Paenibacillus sp. FSL R5-0912]
MNRCTAGIDVGGTKTLLCLTDEDGTVLEQYKLETQLSREPEVFFRWLFGELEQFCRRNGTTLSSLQGVGIGFPGVMNERTGTLTSAPALNWPAMTDIRPVIAAHYPGLVALDNDVNMAAMGEYAAGSATGSEHFIMITVGTGVGSALFLNGQLYRGASFAAGEIGYLIVEPGVVSNATDPEYSEFGPFEMEVSGTGIGAKAAAELYKNSSNSLIRELAQGGRIRAEHVFAAAQRKDETAMKLLDQAYEQMAAAVKNIALTLDLELVILGGGVVEKNPGYVQEIAARVSRYTPQQSLILRQAVLGNQAGAIGAAAAARSRLAAGTGKN